MQTKYRDYNLSSSTSGISAIKWMCQTNKSGSTNWFSFSRDRRRSCRYRNTASKSPSMASEQ